MTDVWNENEGKEEKKWPNLVFVGTLVRLGVLIGSRAKLSTVHVHNRVLYPSTQYYM